MKKLSKKWDQNRENQTLWADQVKSAHSKMNQLSTETLESRLESKKVWATLPCFGLWSRCSTSLRQLFVQSYSKWTRTAGFTKKREEFAGESYSESWKPCLLIDFVQMVTLTVGFLNWVSTIWHFSRCLWTIFFVLIFYGGFY